MSRRYFRASWCALGSLAAALVLSPAASRPAQACGGFWCSQAAPVVQAAEQIIFVDHPGDTVTTIVQIQYAGPAEKFAWLIPIPGEPEIAVSSNIAFQRLEQSTAPQYTLQQELRGTCRPESFAQNNALPSAAAAPSAGSGASAPMAPAVTVVQQGSVGPYDYVTISLDPNLADPAQVAFDWFEREGYDFSSLDSQLLGPYLADGLNLLAFKLTKGASTLSGTIRPVMLTYRSEKPMIPIRPTAVAAMSNMGIRVWVASETQAVPDNYKSLVLNEALINWFSYTQNYAAVVTAAADEAGGQGFVTELAGKTDLVSGRVYTSADDQQWRQYSTRAYASPAEAVVASRFYSGWDGYREAIAASAQLPAGISVDQYIANPGAFSQLSGLTIETWMRELYERVVKPVLDTQQLLTSRPYLTRLFSTMSADEMTVDPAFTYNADLADVSNVHTAKQIIECSASVSRSEAPWRIELPQGGVIRGRGRGAWPVAMQSMPANLKVVQLSTRGSGLVVQDNSNAIGLALLERNGEAQPTGRPQQPAAVAPKPPAMPPNGVLIGGDQRVSIERKPSGKSTRACNVAVLGARVPAPTLPLVLAALLAFALRRRTAKDSHRSGQ